MRPFTPVIAGQMHVSKKFKEEFAAARVNFATDHLPGPWFHIGQGDIICGQAPDTHDVATVYRRQDGTTEGNAALIAAAPDMLAALRRAHRMLTRDRIDDAKMAVVEQVDAAITKATIVNNR